MRVNIEQELIAIATKRKQKAKNNDVITEVNRLLEYDNLRDLDIMNKLAPMSVTERAKDEKGAVIEIEKAEDYYGGAVFEIEQIISLAKKYRLKFLPSSLYKSYMDMTIPQEIKKMEKQIGESMTKERAKRENKTLEEYVAEKGNVVHQFDAHELREKFFVLAPANCFQLEKKGMITKRVPDPILFYQTTGGNYKIVKKWGNDFTITRRIKGWLWSNQARFRFFVVTLPVIIFTALLLLGAELMWHNEGANWVISICGILATFAVQFGGSFKEEAFLNKGWCTSKSVFGFYRS